MTYLIRKTAPDVAPFLWHWFTGNNPGWVSNRKFAIRFESREAAEFAALGLEGVEVAECNS